MTDGTFLSRAWPSIVALVGTVAVVIGLLFMFGDDGAGGDEATAGDEAAPGDQAPDGESVTTDPDAQQTTGGASDGDGETSGEPDDGGDGNQTEEPSAAPTTPVEAPAELRKPVGILNSTTVAGLAAGAQQRFIDGGWEVPATGNSSRQMEGTTAYYPNEELRESAEALQAQFPEIQFVEPTVAGLTTNRIVVILADDYAEAVGEIEQSG